MIIYMHTLTVDPSTAEWSTTIQDHPRQQFTQPVGPKEPITGSPSEIFGLFFTPEILGYIVEETNRYAQQMMTPAQLLQWKPLTVEELKPYMGFCILMGIVKKPALEDYWKKDPIFTMPQLLPKSQGKDLGTLGGTFTSVTTPPFQLLVHLAVIDLPRSAQSLT